MASKDKESEELKRRDAERKRRERAKATDIGQIDDIADVERRESCRLDFGRFCKTYLGGEVFQLEWSDSHLIAIKRIEEAVLVGGNFAFAMPRGSGKSSLSRAGVLWAVLYGHSSFTYLIGANASKGEEALDALKVWLRYVKKITDDFPEVSQAIMALNGVAQRAASQKCLGEPTEIDWTSNTVVLPTVPMPKNHPDYEDGKSSKTSGTIIKVCGLDASGIRGSTHTTTQGHIVRPDFVVLDDPQTDDSARSDTQIEQRMLLINGAVLKMCGPAAKMRAIIPCTIIRKRDLAHRVLDRNESPFWRGTTTKLMPSLPSNMESWDDYFAVYEKCLLADELDMSPANEYYSENRDVLDEGAKHSWPQRKAPDEVSAIQSAMNLYYQNKETFFAELQNDPIDDSAGLHLLSVQEIQAKQSSFTRLEIPDGAAYLTCHIDVHKSILYYSIVAWHQNFTGTVVDYGTFPDQERRLFSHRDLSVSLADMCSFESEEEHIYEGLDSLGEFITNRSYQKPDGSSLVLSKVLIDRGYKGEVVEQFCRDKSSVYQSMAGMGVKAGQRTLVESAARDTIVKGFHWIVRPSSRYGALQWVLADVNFWKTFLHERFNVGQGGKGCLDLFQANVREHEMFAEHQRAEIYDQVYSDRTGRRVKEWSAIPNKDNHYFDTMVGNCVAASMLGCELESVDMAALADKKRVFTKRKFSGFKNAKGNKGSR